MPERNANETKLSPTKRRETNAVAATEIPPKRATFHGKIPSPSHRENNEPHKYAQAHSDTGFSMGNIFGARAKSLLINFYVISKTKTITTNSA